MKWLRNKAWKWVTPVVNRAQTSWGPLEVSVWKTADISHLQEEEVVRGGGIDGSNNSCQSLVEDLSRYVNSLGLLTCLTVGSESSSGHREPTSKGLRCWALGLSAWKCQTQRICEQDTNTVRYNHALWAHNCPPYILRLLSSLYSTCILLSQMHAEDRDKACCKAQPGVHIPSAEETPASRPLAAGSTY